MREDLRRRIFATTRSRGQQQLQAVRNRGRIPWQRPRIFGRGGARFTNPFPRYKRKNGSYGERKSGAPPAKEKKLICTVGDFYRKDAMQFVAGVVGGTPLGPFAVCPQELLYAIFDRIPIPQLLFLSLTSNTFSSQIRRYVLRGNARRRFFDETAERGEKSKLQNNARLDPFYAWGALLKFSTATMDAQSRHLLLGSFFQANEKITNWSGWGRCFMAFCETWTFKECEKLLHAVLRFTGLNQAIRQAVQAEAGKCAQLEIQVRERIRGFFLNHWGKIDGFWTSAVLRTLKTTAEQGRLFMIIFGHVKADEDGNESIDWDLFSQTNVDLQLVIDEALNNIALTLLYLANTDWLGKYAWSAVQIFSLIVEISKAPYVWSMRNYAVLLAHRPQYLYNSLLVRVRMGEEEEAAEIFLATRNVLNAWGVCVSEVLSDPVIRTFQSLSLNRRRMFLSTVLQVEAERMRALLQNVPFDRQSFQDELSALHSTAPLMMSISTHL